jgi:hypothetical protein
MSWSAECLHGMCSACTYEDCECRHHIVDAGTEEPLVTRSVTDASEGRKPNED